MPSQYQLWQRTASALSEICGINDIVETGSNANGWYCKFANGIQICFGILTEIPLSSSGMYAGELWRFETGIIYPASFIEILCVVSDIGDTSSGYCFGSTRYFSSQQFNPLVFCNSDSTNNSISSGSFIAFGRWK